MKQSNMAKISGNQIFWMIMAMEVSSMELLVVRPTIAISRQDAWLSILVGGILGLLITFVQTRICLLYPDCTLADSLQKILGKWTGIFFMVTCILLGMFASGMILRQFADFVHMALFKDTPLWVLIGGLVMLMVYVNYSGGVEGIARCCEIIGPITLITVFVAIVLDFPSINLHWILPIYVDHGWWTIFKGGLPSASFFGQTIILPMIAPFLVQSRDVVSRSMWAVGIVAMVITMSLFFITTTFSPNLSAEMLYPSFEVTRFISVMDFIQNIDSVFVIVWIFGYFAQSSIYLFGIAYGTGRILGLKNWRHTLWGAAIIITVIALLPREFNFASVVFPRDIWLRFALPIYMIGAPLLLWAIGSIRKRRALA